MAIVLTTAYGAQLQDHHPEYLDTTEPAAEEHTKG